MFTPTFILCLPPPLSLCLPPPLSYVYPTFIFMFTPPLSLCLPPPLSLCLPPPLSYVYPTFIFMFTPPLFLCLPHIYLCLPHLYHMFTPTFTFTSLKKTSTNHCNAEIGRTCNYRLPVGCKQCVLCTVQISRTLYLSSLTLPTAVVGTARQRYSCSKNIYFWGGQGGRSTLSIAMKLRVDVFVKHRKRFRAVCAVLPP